MGIRDSKVMVPEDDPEFARFWNAYPRRCSKKEARMAWSKLRPSIQDVDAMITALKWQSPMWATESFKFAPYPASWLRGERWKDERPGAKSSFTPIGDAAEDWLEKIGYCWHTPRCTDSDICRAKRAAEKATR